MINLKNKKILIMAGGTGGHIFPALAVAKKFEEYGAEILWLGSINGMENKIITDYKLFLLSSFGVRRTSILKKLKLPFYLMKNIITAYKIIKKNNIYFGFGFGGYSSGAGGIACKLAQRKLFIHEQNAILGLTNKYLSKIAKKSFSAFPLGNKFITCGNPLRNEILDIYKTKKSFHKTTLNLLIVGGSLGAKFFNDTIPLILQSFDVKDFNIVHQTGTKMFEYTSNNYKNTNLQNVKIIPFIKNMNEMYDFADIIICRAGALTVSEVAVSGCVAIFIPLPSSVDNHQFFNASFLSSNNGAICIEQKDCSKDNLILELKELLKNRKRLQNISESGKRLSVINSSDIIVDEIKKVL